MLLRVIVDSPGDFKKWLEHEASDQKPPVPGDKAAEAFFSQSCVTCHRIRGTSADGSFGPDLTHLMSRQTLASGMIENDPEGKNLERWVKDPQKIKPGCNMPSFGLTDKQVQRIVDYLLTLR
jgi:cytochrome c oxidase subunit 2